MLFALYIKIIATLASFERHVKPFFLFSNRKISNLPESASPLSSRRKAFTNKKIAHFAPIF